MSWKIFTCMSNCRDPENRSRKNCVCGGHNWSNAKKNKHHHGTASKLAIRTAMKEREKWKMSA
jgi:hypothetical protein